jgi:hypothetical protein
MGPSTSLVGPEGGRPAILWHQLDTALAGMCAKRRQREHRCCRVGLAKKHGRSTTWWLLNCPLSQNRCCQVKELPLGRYKYPLRSPLEYTHSTVGYPLVKALVL